MDFRSAKSLPALSMFNRAYNTTVSHSNFTNVGHDQHNTIHTQNITYSAAEKESILSSLNPVDRGEYYVPPCMEGTRKAIFEQIDSWLLDVKASNVLWISGSPGAGKSSIASSLVSRLSERGQLGASFFFKRGDAALSNPDAVWRTIAFDLAGSDAAIARKMMANLMGKKVDPAWPNIALHFKYMIEEPLKYKEAIVMFDDDDDDGKTDLDARASWTRQGNNINTEKRLQNGGTSTKLHPIVVLDALDECGSDSPQSIQRRTLLNTLTNWSNLPGSFKLIVTSRDDGIPKIFRDVCHHISLDTGDLVSSDSNNDVQTFFESRFADIAASYPSLSTQPWPDKSTIKQLTDRAAGLFIWADTVVRFVEQGVASEQLDLLMASGFREGGNRVDALYAQILDLSFKDCKADIYDRFTAVVGAIVLAKVPLRRSDLKLFVGTQENEPSIDFILQKLSSVISTGAKDGIVRVCHLSFTEFVCSSERFAEPFVVSRSLHSEIMALTCLRILNRELKFNICGLETSYLRNDEVQDLPIRVEEMIPVYLLYSCHFFAEHLQDIAEEKCGVALLGEIERFLHFQFLFWLEVMSLREWISVAVTGLQTLTQWLKIYSKELSAFAADAERFVVDFQVPISASVPHIYLSALPFAAHESRISQHFGPRFSKTLSLPEKGNHWSSLVDVLSRDSSYVWSGSFMPDGRSSVSGSRDGKICTWDAYTGKILSDAVDEHPKWIWSAGFSPNGRAVVSISGHQTIMLDATAEELPPDDETASITSIAFSPSGRRIVSCSADRTIHIWHAENGKLVSSPPKIHKNRVTSLALSPDAKRAVSGSWDTTIYIWDADTGHVLYGPLRGHARGVNSVAFAPDGRRVVSGSDDRTVCIWDAETEKIVSGPFRGHTEQVTTVAFSPDGRSVVSGSADRMIRIWDAQTGKTVCGPLEGHTDSVTAVIFSLSGRHVVSGSVDRNIRVWDADTGQLLLGPLVGHTGAIFSVAISPDERRIVSTAFDQTIRVWRADPVESVNLHLSDEWICDPVVSGSQTDETGGDSQRLLFWAPPECRKGICGEETVSIIGESLTRPDFSRFVHGTLWEQCHTPQSSATSPAQLVRSWPSRRIITSMLVLVLLAPSIFHYSYKYF